MTKRRLVEHAKTLAIILLAASALLLIQNTGYFTHMGDLLRPGGDEAEDGDGGGSTGAALGSTLPAGVCVLYGGEGKYSVIYDGLAAEDCYRRFSALFGEALGSAGDAEEISEAEWREALSGEGVVFLYRDVQRLDVLASWLGTEMSGAAARSSGTIFIMRALGGGSAELYYMDGAGAFHRCATAVSSQTLLATAEGFRPNGAAFAFESEGLGSVSPYTLIPGETPEVGAVGYSNPIGASVQLPDIYRAFDMNAGVLRQYSESDGTVVLVEGSKTLRISPDGRVSFSGGGGESGRISCAEAAGIAYGAARQVVEPACGEARITLSGVSVNERTGRVTVTFAYTMGGIAVLQSGGAPAAEFVVGADGIEEAVLNLREFYFTGASEELLPVGQACAIASSEGAPELEIVYSESGGEIRAIWNKSAD